MGIPSNLDSLTFARRCVAAHFNGTTLQLVEDFAHAGVELAHEDVVAYAEARILTFNVGNAQKTHCYICSSPAVHGKLCGCYDSVTPKRHYNVLNKQLLAELPPDTVVETFACEECALLGETTAARALAIYARHGAYKPDRFCGDCFEDKKRQPRAKRPRKEKPAEAPRPAQGGRQYLTDLLEKATESVTQGQA